MIVHTYILLLFLLYIMTYITYLVINLLPNGILSSGCCVTGGLPAAEAAGNSCLLQHAAAQLRRGREGPQKVGA